MRPPSGPREESTVYSDTVKKLNDRIKKLENFITQFTDYKIEYLDDYLQLNSNASMSVESMMNPYICDGPHM